MEEEQSKKNPKAMIDKNSNSNKNENRIDEINHNNPIERKSPISSDSKDVSEKEKQASGINISNDTSELDNVSEAQEGVLEREEKVKYPDPHLPISTARDKKARFTKNQMMHIKDLKKEAKKLEKSIKMETDISRQNEQIKMDIIALTENFVKSSGKKKIKARIDELKIMHRKLNRGVLKLKKERALIKACNSMIDKLNSKIPI